MTSDTTSSATPPATEAPASPAEPVVVPRALLELLARRAATEGVTPVPGAEAREVSAFATRLQRPLPPQLFAWLQHCNGAQIGPTGLYGIPPSTLHLYIETPLASYPEWHHAGWLPLSDDGDGTYYVVSCDPELGATYPVFAVDTHEDPHSAAYVVASDLFHFLEFYLTDSDEPTADAWAERWPFSERLVLAQDPAIAECSPLPLPWE